MEASEFDPASAYELPLPSADPQPGDAAVGRGGSLPESFLMQGVLWFCNLRWTVVMILVVFGALGLSGGALARFGLREPSAWPWITAGFLALYNLGVLWHARRLARQPVAGGARASLIGQIMLDLLVLTVVVHFVGSVETYVSFTYLFHIVLSCIFLSRSTSLLVMAVAAGLYLTCVVLEQRGIVALRGVYVGTGLRQEMGRTRGAVYWDAGSAVGIWVVVWYLTSQLSAMVQRRDSALARTNRQLVQAQKERTKHMMRTAHELKAPFAAIDANAQLLLKGFCGELPDEAIAVLQRIEARSRRLAREIQEMLQLANLNSESREALPRLILSLDQVLTWCMTQLEPVALGRGIVFQKDLQPVCTLAVEDHVKMLLANLLSNAVSYSRRNGHVRVTCRDAGPAGPVVSIEDEGIGIPAEKLPHIFDEYYRTNEAVRHNRESSGLGLAIVREVASADRIGVRVQSQPGVGTRFEVRFSPVADVSYTGEEEREARNGVSIDC